MCEEGSGCSVCDGRSGDDIGCLFLGCGYFEDGFLGDGVLIDFDGVVVGFIVGWKCSSVCCRICDFSIGWFILV